MSLNLHYIEFVMGQNREVPRSAIGGSCLFYHVSIILRLQGKLSEYHNRNGVFIR